MKKYNLLTPEGTRDLLFDESTARRTIENKLSTLFTSYGYSEVITPTIEFYDVFNSAIRYFSQESMYKLTDSNGRLLVIRPDSTMPIARLAATRLKDQPVPLKLFYNQNTFRVNPKNSGRDDEISQSGIEIIGGDERLSDFEAISIALEVFDCLGLDDFRFEIGNSAIFKLLIEELGTNEEDTEEIRSFIETKNYNELGAFLDKLPKCPATEALRILPKLFGGSEVFELARGYYKAPELVLCIDKLNTLYNQLCQLGITDKLSVDFSMVNKTDYYTGILFKGYIEGYGKPVLSGGRYDTLLGDFGNSLPATGFGVNVNAAVNAYLTKYKDMNTHKAADIVAFIENGDIVNGIIEIKKLIKNGSTVDHALLCSKDEAIRYGRAKGIHKMLILNNGKKEFQEI